VRCRRLRVKAVGRKSCCTFCRPHSNAAQLTIAASACVFYCDGHAATSASGREPRCIAGKKRRGVGGKFRLPLADSMTC
jgi:hypothetical protein